MLGEGAQVGGNYRVLKKIGEGGMGAVYMAEHTMLGSKAAIKVMLPAFTSDEEVVQRFFNEAKASTAIQHPGIVRVFDMGYLEDKSAYIVMELLQGESLDERLKQRGGRLPIDQAVLIIQHCASALEAAHQKGIIHRDLKPENVFLVPDPQVPGGERAKVLDFGIAKLTDERQAGSVKTRTGTIMGTPAYMSPEQCMGAGDVDRRSDIYALACVLFHLVCGRPPFTGQGVGEILVAQMRDPAPLARDINPEVPPLLDQIMQKALAKPPGERFSSMAEFSNALAGVSGLALGRAGSFAEIAPPAAMPNMGSYPPGTYPPPGAYAQPGTGSQPQIPPGSYPGTGAGPGGNSGSSPRVLTGPPGSSPNMVTGSTLGAASAQNYTHHTQVGTGRSRGLVIGVVAVAVVVGGVLALVAGGEDTPVADGSDEIPVLQPVGNEGVADAAAAGVVETPPQPPDPQIVIEETPPDAAPVVPPVLIELESEPDGATVYLEGTEEPLGTTPFRREFPSQEGKIRLRLELDGYRDKEVSFSGDRGGVTQVRLRKKKSGTRPPRPQDPGGNESGNPLDWR
ncbi:serine/threonine-protein kinase [Haliangium sp.]|uniref:serine/threonine-protein kinase n=1 Tax=Haliangium sp. TaxID=2663208 RepID=UPI003D0CDCFC